MTKVQQDKTLDKTYGEIQTLRQKLQSQKDAFCEKQEKVKVTRRDADKANKVVDDISRGKAQNVYLINSYDLSNTCQETSIDNAEIERESLLRKCKVEGIELPFTKGSLDDITLEAVIHLLCVNVNANALTAEGRRP